MKYSLVKRGNPRYPERGQKVYASAQYHKVLSLDELITHITQHGSSIRRGEIKAVVSHLAEAMAEKMAEGYKVDLGELGKFYPTLDCEGADSYEDFSPDRHIRAIRVHWQPSEEFSHLRDEANFTEVINRRTERQLITAERRGDSTFEVK